ncbi:MAG: enoyl-CoA hydratase/isomerase family protein [Betaproteobacteria bacterium]|nr:enoyl-CoA hydratase/isomerase family protein [Betaproteobacteria bacterium]
MSILVERTEHVATVTLNKPEKMNALDLAMWRELAQTFQGLSADDSLRCIVLRGAGEKAFSAGADIEEFERERNSAEKSRAYSKVTQAALAAIAECRHPTLAQIHGACVGGGLEMATMCDMRICGESSRFGVPINRLGLVVSYEELGGLVALAGKAGTLEILLEGRVFSAEEALRKGLVNRFVADADVAAEVGAAARRIAQGAPLVARWHKKFINRMLQSAPLTAEERDEVHLCFDTEDFRIGWKAFLAKERAAFVGR